MEKLSYKELKKGTFAKHWRSGQLSYNQLKSLPINLQKVARRELRNENITLPKRPRHPKPARVDPKEAKFDSLVRNTEKEITAILESSQMMSDIPSNITKEELKGKIAVEEGTGMTIFVERDGLEKLTIMLPQKMPTIANLKRAIEVTSRAQLERDQHERYNDNEECFQRLHKTEETSFASKNSIDNNSSSNGNPKAQVKPKTKADHQQNYDEKVVEKSPAKANKVSLNPATFPETQTNTMAKAKVKAKEKAKSTSVNWEKYRQLAGTSTAHVVDVDVAGSYGCGFGFGFGFHVDVDVADSKSDMTTTSKLPTVSLSKRKRSTGELVCSVARNGHAHRPNVSWRFLWRAYSLYNLDSKQPVDDSDGRNLLSELGIENACTLKFNHREKYCGRKRQ